MSRKPKISKERTMRICQALEIGATYTIAAEAGGITRKTLYNWFDKAAKPRADKIYTEFVEKFSAAEAAGALFLLGEIKKQTPKDWRAAAWILERRHDMGKDKARDRLSERTFEDSRANNNFDYKSLLKEQMTETKEMLAQSRKSGSWQASAAILKSYISIAMQLRALEAEEGALDKIDSLTDEQLLTEITNAIITLPPIYRQRVAEDVRELAGSNVIALKRSDK